MDKNKERMEREKVITLLRLVKENGLKIDIAADEICSLFDVVGQSEQCTHENEVQRQGDGFIYTVCGDCGEDLD